MNFLIDTNILIYTLQRRSGPVFHDFLFQLTARGLSFISVISRFEVLAGTTEAFKKSNKTFLDSFPCLDMTQEISDRAGGLFRDYKKRGMKVDNEDLFLAASALEEGLSLVTTNVKHFPLFKTKEQHHISFKSRKGSQETKSVHVLEI